MSKKSDNINQFKSFNKIINELLEKNGSKYDGDSVYHYTDANGLKGIIESKSLWLTDRNYMNDVYDEEFVAKYAKSFTFEKKGNFSAPNLLAFGKDKVKTPQYIFSTSKEKDLIHQWSYYGDSEAYCIEFDREKLIDALYNLTNEDEEFYYGSVFYVKPDGKRDVKKKKDDTKIVEKALKEYFGNHLSDEEYKKVYHYFYSLIKQYGHYCESEYRFLIQSERETEFKVKNGIFTPYIELKFEDKFPIKSITIGSGNREKLAEGGLRRFLEKNDYTGIPIHFSEMKVRA